MDTDLLVLGVRRTTVLIDDIGHDRLLASRLRYAWRAALVVEVMALVQVRDERGLHGMPSQLLLGQGAGGRAVQRDDGAEEAEVVVGLLTRDGGDWQPQVLSDDLGDVPKRHALFTDPVQSRAGRGGFQGQPEQMRGVKAVHGGPSVGPTAHIGRDTFRASDADENRDKTMITFAVHRRWESHHRDAHAAR